MPVGLWSPVSVSVAVRCVLASSWSFWGWCTNPGFPGRPWWRGGKNGCLCARACVLLVQIMWEFSEMPSWRRDEVTSALLWWFSGGGQCRPWFGNGGAPSSGWWLGGGESGVPDSGCKKHGVCPRSMCHNLLIGSVLCGPPLRLRKPSWAMVFLRVRGCGRRRWSATRVAAVWLWSSLFSLFSLRAFLQTAWAPVVSRCFGLVLALYSGCILFV
jgi:hypothetical protein